MLLTAYIRATLALLMTVSAFAALAATTPPSATDDTTSVTPLSSAATAAPVPPRQHMVLTRGSLRGAHVAALRVTSSALQGSQAAAAGALALQSSVALVVDQSNSDVLFARRADVALPIASITKLMTSLVVLESNQDMDELLEITNDDLDTEKGTRSRLAVGTIMSRRDLMHIALMSSENRAAHALCRNYPGGLVACLRSMNIKALELGMTNTHFTDPTGLSSQNVASAEDLAKLLGAASANPTIRDFSTDRGYSVPVGRRMVAYRNTNNLVSNPGWDIVVQKTGYIVEAGKCLVMEARIEGKSVLIVLLDSVGKYTRFGDANRIKHWMESHPSLLDPADAPAHQAVSLAPRVQS